MVITRSPTGYGQQTAIFTPKLAEHYELAISSFYGLNGSPLNYNGIKVYPGLEGNFGNDTIPFHADHFFDGDLRGGLVVTLMDVWVLNALAMRQMDIACWVPVDHDPVPDPVAGFFRTSGAIPIAMSRFGAEQLAEFDPLYVPHAVDTSVYKPHDKADCRKRVGLPEDAFLVGMVAANKGNPSRKCFTEAMLAFRAFHEKHPEAVLYLHTEKSGRYDGVNLEKLMDRVGLPERSVFFADQYAVLLNPPNPQVMALLYGCMDVLLNPAAGEGFGITPLEAQACGIPAIVTDFTAMPEVTGAGWHVEYDDTFTHIGSWQARPKVEDIVAALEDCFSMDSQRREKMALEARRHATKYDVETVFTDYMLPALAEIEQRFDALRPVEIAA